MTAPGALRFNIALQDINGDAVRRGGDVGARPEKAGAAARKNVQMVFSYLALCLLHRCQLGPPPADGREGRNFFTDSAIC